MDENINPRSDTTSTIPKPELPENLVTALRELVDPEIGLDVVALGLIRAAHEQADPVQVDMILTTPFCPYGGWMIQQVKEISERVYAKPVKVNVLADLWDPNYMEDPGLLGGW